MKRRLEVELISTSKVVEVVGCGRVVLVEDICMKLTNESAANDVTLTGRLLALTHMKNGLYSGR
jgi:hypothetical protein